MPDRTDYWRERYQRCVDKTLAEKKMRYQTDSEFRERQRRRDRQRYYYRKTWGGLLDIDPEIFVKSILKDI